ncbi:hypothetical protein BOTBODRAFT_173149 [Botryobasidium botryosum FD-172 SS1]|uniref:Uncharacterized protein n=1 Tax=Botryobasidium botryosum (strain FD-172 SS1) TaxID=930990 RepID=A0A067MKE6_BOTB1|nr:hypothetical protein BOTBODRAFT_173149 [Botryobasidium botryosum FD-172 SS1]
MTKSLSISTCLVSCLLATSAIASTSTSALEQRPLGSHITLSPPPAALKALSHAEEMRSYVEAVLQLPDGTERSVFRMGYDPKRPCALPLEPDHPESAHIGPLADAGVYTATWKITQFVVERLDPYRPTRCGSITVVKDLRVREEFRVGEEGEREAGDSTPAPAASESHNATAVSAPLPPSEMSSLILAPSPSPSVSESGAMKPQQAVSKAEAAKLSISFVIGLVVLSRLYFIFDAPVNGNRSS